MNGRQFCIAILALVFVGALTAREGAACSNDQILRKQLELVGKNIHAKTTDLKLLYMVLLLQKRDFAKVTAFYIDLDEDSQADFYVRMTYAQALIAMGKEGDASSQRQL